MLSSVFRIKDLARAILDQLHIRDILALHKTSNSIYTILLPITHGQPFYEVQSNNEHLTGPRWPIMTTPRLSVHICMIPQLDIQCITRLIATNKNTNVVDAIRIVDTDNMDTAIYCCSHGSTIDQTYVYMIRGKVKYMICGAWNLINIFIMTTNEYVDLPSAIVMLGKHMLHMTPSGLESAQLSVCYAIVNKYKDLRSTKTDYEILTSPSLLQFLPTI